MQFSTYKTFLIPLLGLNILILSLIVYNPITNEEYKLENVYFSEDSLSLGGSIVSPFEIDGNAEWVIINNTYSWCTGSGTKTDPFIIKNITIDATISSSCIHILNSDVFFKIKNCTFKNAGLLDYAGVKITHTSNGTIEENLFIDNRRVAIDIFESENITISDNTIKCINTRDSDLDMGIYCIDSIYCKIKNNILFNVKQGITNAGHSNKCINNIIHIKTVQNPSQSPYGILISDQNQEIRQNKIYNCGFWISHSNNFMHTYTIDDTNLVNGKPLYFFYNETNLSNSNFSNAGQIILGYCNDSLISNFNFNSSGNGISLQNCFNISVKNCSFQECYRGIWMDECHNSTFFNNTLSKSPIVSNSYSMSNFNNITRNYSHQSEIRTKGLRNNISNNILIGEGINSAGNNNTISNNSINGATEGLWIQDEYNQVIKNTVLNCKQGIFLYFCEHSNISLNTLSHCKEGVYLSFSYNNSVKNNKLICVSVLFTEVNSQNNTIEDNEYYCDENGNSPNDDDENSESENDPPEYIFAYPHIFLYLFIGTGILSIIVFKHLKKTKIESIK